MSKILITTEGGMVTSVSTDSLGVQIVLVDYDKNADYEDDVSVSGILEPDNITFANLYELYNGSKDPQEQAVCEQLKQLNF